jgi:hypothetical protein
MRSPFIEWFAIPSWSISFDRKSTNHRIDFSSLLVTNRHSTASPRIDLSSSRPGNRSANSDNSIANNTHRAMETRRS